jgi:hypothetical protein
LIQIYEPEIGRIAVAESKFERLISKRYRGREIA